MYAARFNTASAQGLPVRSCFPVNIYFSVISDFKLERRKRENDSTPHAIGASAVQRVCAGEDLLALTA